MAETMKQMTAGLADGLMQNKMGTRASGLALPPAIRETKRPSFRPVAEGDKSVAEPCGREGCTAAGAIRFGGHLFCSAGCLGSCLRGALQAERQQAWSAGTSHGERPEGKILLGRILVEQGAVTEEQLHGALRAQRAAGTGKLGSWLKQQAGLSEEDLASALGIQWRCPLFRVGTFDPAQMAGLLPRQLMESCCAIPLRVTGSPKRLVVCFEDRVDAQLMGALTRMHGMDVDAGLLTATGYWQATRELLGTRPPRAEETEANSLEEVGESITRWIANGDASSVRVVAVHDRFWARGVFGESAGAASHRDLLCTLRTAVQ